MRVTPIRGDGSYYLADLATELGPLVAVPEHTRPDRPSAPSIGRWVGGAALGLGLDGAVEPHALASVLAGRHPGTDRPLAQRRGSCRAYDLTFAAPKSASVLLAIGGSPVGAAVLDAHHEAVGAALDYVEGHALAVRRGTGDARELLATGGALGASFTHGVSRSLDPHLHTHVVVANLAHGDDGRWTAVDGRGLFAHQVAAGALYDAHLRKCLGERLGVEWDLRRNGRFEIAGVDPLVIGGFSSRHAEIRQHLAERSLASRRADQVAWAATRDPKDVTRTHRSVARVWDARASALGVDRTLCDRVVGRRTGGRDDVDEYRFAATLASSPHGVVTRRDVVAGFGASLAGGARGGDVERLADLWVPVPSGRVELGVREEGHALGDVLPRGYLTRALGPRPSLPRHHAAWKEVAAAVEDYRARWGVTDRDHALGTGAGGNGLVALPARRVAEHVTVVRRIEELARATGRERPREIDRSPALPGAR